MQIRFVSLYCCCSLNGAKGCFFCLFFGTQTHTNTHTPPLPMALSHTATAYVLRVQCTPSTFVGFVLGFFGCIRKCIFSSIRVADVTYHINTDEGKKSTREKDCRNYKRAHQHRHRRDHLPFLIAIFISAISVFFHIYVCVCVCVHLLLLFLILGFFSMYFGILSFRQKRNSTNVETDATSPSLLLSKKKLFRAYACYTEMINIDRI